MTEPAPGCRFLVVPTDLNECNTFWEGYIGKSGTVAKVSADGLITVIMDDGNVCEGIKPERFSFSDEPMFVQQPQKPWWKRILFFWR
jgi:hypothetical protein